MGVYTTRGEVRSLAREEEVSSTSVQPRELIEPIMGLGSVEIAGKN